MLHNKRRNHNPLVGGSPNARLTSVWRVERPDEGGPNSPTPDLIRGRIKRRGIEPFYKSLRCYQQKIPLMGDFLLVPP